MPQSTKIASHDGTISVIITKRILGKEECRHPRQQDSRPLPKTPPDTPCTFFCVVRARTVHIIHRVWFQKYQQLRVDRMKSFSRPQQPLLAAPSSRK